MKAGDKHHTNVRLNHARAAYGLALSLALGLAGCASTEPAPTLLALPTVAASAAVQNDATRQTKPRYVAVKRVGVPEYLQARAVRYRADDATLAAWPQTVWAERIEVAVTRNFVAALQKQLPGWTVCDGLCAWAASQPLLTVEFTQADLLRGAHVLRAQLRWSLASSNGLNVLAQGAASFDEPAAADTPSAHAQALARVLERVAQTLAPAVQKNEP